MAVFNSPAYGRADQALTASCWERRSIAVKGIVAPLLDGSLWVESGYDTIAKVAAAERKGLERIAGMNPQKVQSIVTQARKMVGEAEKSRHTWLKDRSDG